MSSSQDPALRIKRAIELCDQYLASEKIEQCTEAILNAQEAEEWVKEIKAMLEEGGED